MTDVLDKGSLKKGRRLPEVVAPVSQVSACQGSWLLKGKCIYFIQLCRTNSSISTFIYLPLSDHWSIGSFLSFQNLDFQNEAKLRLAPGQVQHYSYEKKIHIKDFVNTCRSFKMMVGETLKFSIEITALMSSRKTFRLQS